ncbi:DHA2 family efflux MFS transporter permease subunit [Holzapfeliella floricola]|uniref:Major facilitator superfamily permease n=1 Tax=Holzapfeliella floricola DSM 23037 = JCM 16512 TaxID=1423744 RepID=A0A0R2DX12_9LACO|nr:DHA2 family efflux MFS transporter permease subunit [Holzapfeliella floricola]KRN04740.1 major facilitator superfamily permease [Holzapfeliella floricola DSM 23037 = JCM 16512]
MAVIATGIMSFCGVVVETAMNIAFPALMTEFQVGTSTVQWMTTSYLLTLSIIVPLSATLKKRFTNKTLFSYAILFFIVGVVIDAIAPNFILLILGRVIQGIGTGIALPLMFNIILEQVPKEKIGIMMGVGSLITAIAPAVGPTFGGLIISNLGWRYIFIILIPVLVVTFLLGFISIQQASQTSKTNFDYLSLAFIMLTFVGLIIGLSNMGTHSLISLPVIGFLAVGLLGLLALIVRSNRIDNPVINFTILTNKKFSIHLFSFFVLQFLTLSFSFILPNYIQLVNNSNATVAGLLLLPAALMGAILSPFSGLILDKFGPQKPIILGSSLILIGTLLFWIFSSNLSNLLITIFYIVYMIGLGFAFGNIMTNSLKQLSKEQNADGNALLNTLQQFAGAMGTAVISTIITQTQQTTHSYVNGAHNAIILLVILSILEVVLISTALKKKKPH